MQRVKVTLNYDDGTLEEVVLKPVSLVAAERHFKGSIPGMEGTLWAAHYQLRKEATFEPETFTAFAQAAQRRYDRWTHADEIAAATLETVHALYRLTAAAAGVKTHNLPKPLTYPRPAHVRRSAPLVPAASRDEIRARFLRGR